MAMRIEMTSNFEAEEFFAKQVKGELRRRVWDAVREVTMLTIRQVKQQMPVDTGAARADWGSSVDENESKLETAHGSTKDYVPKLNEGWSRQAPAGFIDAIAFSEMDALAEFIELAIEGAFD